MKANIVETIKQLKNAMFLSPASNAEVEQAEKTLQLKFAQEYREYVLNFGVATAQGVELTGLTNSPRLSVISVTERERSLSGIPQNMYVVNCSDAENSVILQDEKGTIYEFRHESLNPIFSSLSEYISSLQGGDAV